jgi:hypothetical protein
MAIDGERCYSGGKTNIKSFSTSSKKQLKKSNKKITPYVEKT